MKDWDFLQKKLNLHFNNKDLLIQAFVHRSYLNEHPRFHLSHNERLEFLGDAVLELVVTEYLYKNYPSSSEGELTNWRASLVNAQRLAQTALELDLEPYLFLSKGEAKERNSKSRLHILANAFEALIGAIYLDQGYKKAQEFIHMVLIPKLPKIIEEHLYIDPKSHFQEKAQEKLGITPEYKVLEEKGPDHAKHFKVGVYLGEELIAEGEGSSKHEAQTAAAQKALEKKGW